MVRFHFFSCAEIIKGKLWAYGEKEKHDGGCLHRNTLMDNIKIIAD